MMKVSEAQWIKDQCLGVLDRLITHTQLMDRCPELDIRDSVKDRVRMAETVLLFGIDVPEDKRWSVYMHLNDYSRIVHWSHGNDISCPDVEGQQPEIGEPLYAVSFPCGPYHLVPNAGGPSKPYPRESFDKLFRQLRDLGAKYSDTANSVLYFDPHKAPLVHARLGEIIEQARQWAADEAKQERREQLQAELEKLDRGE